MIVLHTSLMTYRFWIIFSDTPRPYVTLLIVYSRIAPLTLLISPEVRYVKPWDLPKDESRAIWPPSSKGHHQMTRSPRGQCQIVTRGQQQPTVHQAGASLSCSMAEQENGADQVRPP